MRSTPLCTVRVRLSSSMPAIWILLWRAERSVQPSTDWAWSVGKLRNERSPPPTPATMSPVQRGATMSIAVATLQLAACSLLVSPDDYVGTRPLDSLWAYYRFDGDTVDSSGSAHDGILAGATATLDGSGVIGTALTCVNAGDKVKISDDFAPGTSSFTLAMFYRIEMTGGGIAAHSLNTFIVKGSAFEDSTNDQPGFGIGYNDTTQNVAGFIRDNVSAHAWVSTHAAASSGRGRRACRGGRRRLCRSIRWRC